MKYICFLFLILLNSNVFSGQVMSSSVQFDSINMKGESVSLSAQISRPDGKFEALDISILGKEIILDWISLNALEHIDLNSLDVKHANGCFYDVDRELCYSEYSIQFIYGNGCEQDDDYGQLVYSISYNLTSKESSFENYCSVH